ncbi:NUDIX domain-containing protein [Arcticibacter tournemirensis]|uniref:NUDIX domain-containing protein n=1 Tax=Arcticibacter tournemirensis TaxID=699437 RepID=A0A5M9GN49_9SPHI|nr:NUDIX domain-containing protein [Arcticibacter tournemirensis]KAA8475177.1 NUDIX domain-containing protein [Arcticibacter tournemirensis]TQM52434.1 NUDIX domain-containing protein [Arcticibacter tournemirensis]
MYRIYINDTALIIADFMPANIGSCQQIDVQSFDFREFYKQAKKGTPAIHVMVTKDPKRMFRKLRKPFTLIHAAGGVVKNEANQYLFIFRKGKWDLPKGKLDDGEKTKVAAEREVAEECGIKVSEVGGKLCKTWHVYEDKGQVVFKKTVWYNMRAKNQKLIPQLEEEITEARWIAPGEFSTVKQNTFALIKDVLSLIEV